MKSFKIGHKPKTTFQEAILEALVFGVLHTSGQALLDGDLRAIRLEPYESFRTFIGITPRDGKKSQSH